jgi:hypothetical protein
MSVAIFRSTLYIVIPWNFVRNKTIFQLHQLQYFKSTKSTKNKNLLARTSLTGIKSNDKIQVGSLEQSGGHCEPFL